LVTGATGALGNIITETLSELGSDLILVDRPGSDLTGLEDRIARTWDVKVISIECDLEAELDRTELADEIVKDNQGLNCLINNAAFVGSSELTGWVEPFERQTVETWRRALEVNLTAAFHLSQLLSPLLREGTGGNIINVTSIYGEYAPDWSLYEGTSMGNPAAYGVSKGGLAQLTRWLSTTLAPDVRVNAMAPGGIFRNQAREFVEKYEKRTPLQRMATEDDFRGVIAFLASDLSGYVTGQVLNIDGGWGAW